MFAFPRASFHGVRVSSGARVVVTVFVLLLLAAGGLVWLIGSNNPYTPAGYVGYLT